MRGGRQLGVPCGLPGRVAAAVRPARTCSPRAWCRRAGRPGPSRGRHGLVIWKIADLSSVARSQSGLVAQLAKGPGEDSSEPSGTTLLLHDARAQEAEAPEQLGI
eukprot:1227352-Pyramimonas_sp.AAC.1